MFAATLEGMESQPSTSSSTPPCRQFHFDEILLATDNFDESLVIGQGGFGKVYKGYIINGSSVQMAAIKRLDIESSQGAAEFWTEVQMLSKLRHCHLVSLFGYCNHEKEMILVYEYMPNGTLADHLHKFGTPLSWLERLKICVGAGRGLHYLHTGTGIETGVIHRDVKSSNILLHESWAAKISDFGLSKISPTNQQSTYVYTLVKGTFGYLDPDYSFTGKLTRKSDVYAFGVVLMEVLCRKPALDRSVDEVPQNLARWVQESIKEGNLKHIIDSGIRGEISPKCLKKFVRIAEACLQSNPKQRPTMAEVVVALESVLTLQEKINTSLQFADKTIFGRMLDMLHLPSNIENPAGVQMGTNNHVPPQEEEENGFYPNSPVCAVAATATTTPNANLDNSFWIDLSEEPDMDINQVPFSRTRFEEHQAETYWCENDIQVDERYNIGGRDYVIKSPVFSELDSPPRSNESMATPAAKY